MKLKWTQPVNAAGDEILKLKYASELLVISQTGSRAYGTNRPDSDYDYRGVYCAPLKAYAGITTPTQTIDIPEPDITLYELKHFCKLAADANPTILEILWCGQRQTSPQGDKLIANRKLFLSKRIAKTYAGYAMAQLGKAKEGTGGSRGQNHLKREKFKLHTIRLVDAGYAGVTTGEIPVKVKDPEWLWDMARKPLDEIEAYVKVKKEAIDRALAHSDLPDLPDYDAINDLMYEIRKEIA
jgi:predicted nucleotidyltransferase